MSIETVARRYAVALADVVTKNGEIEIIRDELGQFAALMTGNPQLLEIFRNPAVPFENKRNVLESLIAKARPAKTTANFLRVLQRNHRLADLPVVNERFNTVLEERAGLITAEVTTAQPLAAAQQTALQTRLQEITGKRVKLDFRINPEIIGGVVTRIGSTVYDGSVKNQLQQLKEKMIRS